MQNPLLPLLASFSWRELLHHPWRNAAAVVSVMLGVALAFSVHVINASALDEFSQAVRSVNGQPDLELREFSADDSRPALTDALLATLMRHPSVAVAAPVLEFTTYAHSANAQGPRTLLKVVGVDFLQAARLMPDLMPVPGDGAGRMDFFAPDAIYLNASARTALAGSSVRLQRGLQTLPLRVAGSVRAGGSALAVMDIAAVQDLLDKPGHYSRIDLQLAPGVQRGDFAAALIAEPNWPAGLVPQEPGDAVQRIGNLSRAYRVNLTVLALVALFTGSFLVFSVLALSVARRSQQFALLAVLGLTGTQRLQLVLMEASVLGLVGSVLGIALGTVLASTALHVLGGDLGGGYFAGAAPALQWSLSTALIYMGLGLCAAGVGAWWPAQQARSLPPAQTLKGLGLVVGSNAKPWWGLGLLCGAVALALMPPVAGIPLAAYVSVALVLLGGIALLPWMLGLLFRHQSAWVRQRPVWLLAFERAHRMRDSAAVAVSGVVAALSLAVALTVMVASFRNSVNQWLDTVLPADLYVRTAGNLASTETAYFTPEFVRAAARVQGVQRLAEQRTRALQFAADKPPVTLIARTLHSPGSAADAVSLPLVGNALEVPAGHIGVYVSEAMVDLYGARPGTTMPQLKQLLAPTEQTQSTTSAPFFVAGVWRDYARQFGTVAMDLGTYQRLSQDTRINDIAFWLRLGAASGDVQAALRGIVDGEAGRQLEFGTASQIRATTLVIFDRSFAVTYWLQAVAIGIGLFGVAASFSAQVLARRKEFGLLAHLGLTRRQVLQVVAFEGATWTALGSLAGLGLGLAVAVVLVKVVNPQSFHWTMDLAIPWGRLLLLCAAVVVAGTVTAWLSGRAAASQDAVLAVKEDW